MTTSISTPETPTAGEKSRELWRNLAGNAAVESDPLNSDNLAIALASYFSRHIARPEDDADDPETGWGAWVMRKTYEALDLIVAELYTDPEKLKAIERERDELKAEVERLRIALDWQNAKNNNPAAHGAYEFYINEEWEHLARIALDSMDATSIASLMKRRYDPDDERVRVRRVNADDALIAEIDRLRAENAERSKMIGEMLDAEDRTDIYGYIETNRAALAKHAPDRK